MITKVRMVAPEIGMRSALADKASPEERRAYRRTDVSLEVQIEHEGTSYRGRTRDLSLGGMKLETHAPMAQGTSVSLLFHLTTDPEPIRCLAVVRWVDRSGVLGLQFLGLRARATWALQKMLNA